MDSFSAMIQGMASRGNELMVFDWEKASRIIVERNAKEASAGLCSDWEYTGGSIFRDGKPVPQDETYTFLASTWATPELEVDGVVMDCYKMQSEVPEWDSKTFWPPEALAILDASKEETS